MIAVKSSLEDCSIEQEFDTLRVSVAFQTQVE